jgi:hypothetical protein
LGCQQPLVAKNHGKKIRPHFAHHVDRACEGAFESSIHRRAKELIVDKSVLMLPAWDGDEGMPNPPSAADDDGRLHQGRRLNFPSTMIALTEARAEVQRGDYRPDVVATDLMGDLLIEIRVTHAVGDQKTRNVQSDGHRMMEIDLSKITADQAEDPDLFEHLVLNTASNRIWISQPTAAAAWRESRDELKESVRARNLVIAARRSRDRKLREENDAQKQARAARKERYRLECREPYQAALAALNDKISRSVIEATYRRLLERDRSSADKALDWVTEESARSYLRVAPELGWVYQAHPYLWQAGAYLRFIEGKSPGQTFEQAALGRWIRDTYGVDEVLWSLFRAQWVARHEALKSGYRMRLPWAWFFTREENRRIPNFFEPIDEFVGKMMRCGVLTRDSNRRGWLTICTPPRMPSSRIHPLPSLQTPAQLPPTLTTSVLAAPVSFTPVQSDQTSDPLLGKSIAHENLGIGVVMTRLVRCSPVYDVRFEHGNSRRILLRSDHNDWAVIDSALSSPLAS